MGLAMMNPYSWVFLTGVSLAFFGLYELGSGLVAEPIAWIETGTGALMLVAGAILAPLGMWVWNRR
ncbi:MAG TPA: hypothetical protein VGR28_13595 [Candidatus Thermoplasmatota archaeon]|jgi:hypothetical protein|nr:hypothetical protein [Candidatus Thermoplasmatota archaeon]